MFKINNVVDYIDVYDYERTKMTILEPQWIPLDYEDSNGNY
jgi:hypothetical protein